MPEGLHRPGGDDPVGEFLQVGQGPVAEHLLALPGRAGEHEHVGAAGYKGHPRGGAPVVVQHGAAFRDHGLLEVVLGDRGAPGGEALPDPLGGGLVVDQLLAKGLGHGHLGQVVTGGPQAPGGDEDVRPAPGDVHRLADPLGVVPHHGVVVDVDPQLGQALGDHLGVGVGDVPQQQLGAHGDEFSGVAHGSSTTLSMPSTAAWMRVSMSSTASASRISSSLGWVLGCRGVKTVQQSS